MAFSTLRRRPELRSRAFSLIELLVVIGIIIVVTSVVLVNNARFGGSIQLANFAYDVAFTIRQAQVYGISVAGFQGSNFSTGYGVYFGAPDPVDGLTTYAIFADVNDDHKYSGAAELVKTTTLTGGFTIKKICATPQSGAEVCNPTRLDIVYVRPEPDAWISVSSGVCIIGNTAGCQKSARVELKAPRGGTMSVFVEANGQISVGRLSP